MADPRKKKRQQTPKEHLKRQQAAKRRHRGTKFTPHGGEFSTESKSHLHNIFHHSVIGSGMRHKAEFNYEHPPEDQPRIPGNWSGTKAKQTEEQRTQERIDRENARRAAGTKHDIAKDEPTGKSRQRTKPKAAGKAPKAKGEPTRAAAKAKREKEAAKAGIPLDRYAEFYDRGVEYRAERRVGGEAEDLKNTEHGGYDAEGNPQARGGKPSKSAGYTGVYETDASEAFDESVDHVDPRTGEITSGRVERKPPPNDPREHFPMEPNYESDNALGKAMEAYIHTYRTEASRMPQAAARAQASDMANNVHLREGGNMTWHPDEWEAFVLGGRVKTADQDTLFRGAKNEGPDQFYVNDDGRLEKMDRGIVERKGDWIDRRKSVPGAPLPDSANVKFRPGKEYTDFKSHESAINDTEKAWLKGEPTTFPTPKFDPPQTPEEQRKYLYLRSKGYASSEIMDWMAQGSIVAPAEYVSRDDQPDYDTRKDMYDASMDNLVTRKYGQGRLSKDPTEHGGGSHEDFAYSKQVPHTESLEKLRKRLPNVSEQELVSIHAQEQTAVSDYILERNERWAHEGRSARLRGKSGKNIEKDDRVVFFTTNLGNPTASVPANSTLGQYVIKKRKKMLYDNKSNSKPELRGEYPDAVRDRHLIEVSTGLTLGVQGRYGVFKNVGWRRGNKASKGFGKQAPLGSQVLRDSTGAAIYDKEGNVRYTDGYSRQFSAGTDRDVGLRIFLG